MKLDTEVSLTVNAREMLSMGMCHGSKREDRKECYKKVTKPQLAVAVAEGLERQSKDYETAAAVVQTSGSAPPPLYSDDIFALQRTLGNAFVQRYLADYESSAKSPSQCEQVIRRDEDDPGIRVRAGVPTGVHDARTAIAYAQTRRRMGTYRRASAQTLINDARILDAFLLGTCREYGPEAQSEIAQLLIEMERHMDRVIQEADTGPDMMPVVEGVNWDPGDPLAGTTTGIDPFGNLDIWSTFVQEALPEPPGEQRPRRPREAPGVDISWTVYGEALNAPVEVGRTIFLRAAIREGPGASPPYNYEWVLTGTPEGSRAQLSATDRETATFRIDREGTYGVQLVVENRYRVGGRARRRISTAEAPPEPTPRETLRELIYLADANTFTYWFLTNYNQCIGPLNPIRVYEAGVFSPFGASARREVTFTQPRRSDLEEFRTMLNEGTRITRGNEDGIRYFGYNRRNLQCTVDYWAREFRNTSIAGEGAYNFQNRPEYQPFRRLLGIVPPARSWLNIPMEGDSRFP